MDDPIVAVDRCGPPGSQQDDSGRAPSTLTRLEAIRPAWIGLALFALALVVYLGSNPLRGDLNNHFAWQHFVWQADAWLHGRIAIPFPVASGPYHNDYFQDVMPLPGQPGYGIIPYPPLPTAVVLPFVAILGFQTPTSVIASVLGALNVLLAWRLTQRVSGSRRVALVATLFFGFGTVAWYASAIGSTWYFAHVVAMTATFLAITVALGAPRRQPHLVAAGTGDRAARGIARGSDDLRLFLAGLLLGAAALARLTVIFGAPFILIAGHGPLWRRAIATGAGLAIPMAVLVAYNMAASGEPFSPAYAYAAATETHPVEALYHSDWGVEDPRYIPQNVLLALALPPGLPQECLQHGIDLSCAPSHGLLQPNPMGMSLILTSPVYLLAVPLVRRSRRDRLVAAAAAAVGTIALVNLAHFSQGWIQFGYRFSNDFAPFALILVTLAIARRGVDRTVVALLAASVAVNAWGVYWGVVNHW